MPVNNVMRKKVCFVVSSPLTVKAFLLNHLATLKNEFDLYIVANFVNEADASFLTSKGYNIYDVKVEREINLVKDTKALIDLVKYFKQHKFDIVHSVTPKAGLLAMCAAWIANVRNRVHIFTGQVWYTKAGVMKKLLMLMDRIIANAATTILVDGEPQRQFLINNKIVPPSKSQVLGKGSISGVDVERFNPDFLVRQSIRTELSLQDNNVVFGFLGRLKVDKGILDLANAFKMVLKDNAHIRLLIIGYDEDNLMPQVKEIVKSDESIIFYGSTPKPEVVLQALDVFCLPSYREGFGTSVIEASLLNLPVICSDTYGLMDTIIDGETGLRHRVKDVEDIYKQMLKLTQSAELRKYLGYNGRNYVLENFSAATISNYWLDFYRNF
ncbi:MAG: glycosyltransferase [Spirochaetales bacterium]